MKISKKSQILWYNYIGSDYMPDIKIITDKDFNLDAVELNNPRIRIGARGLVFNNDNKIAILNKRNKNEYKLVGGGVEGNEDPQVAFEREVLEEAGCKIKIDDLIGTIREERTHNNFIQTSYIFTAHVIEDTKKLNLSAGYNISIGDGKVRAVTTGHYNQSTNFGMDNENRYFNIS